MFCYCSEALSIGDYYNRMIRLRRRINFPVIFPRCAAEIFSRRTMEISDKFINLVAAHLKSIRRLITNVNLNSCIWFLLFIIIAILPASSSYPTTDNSADNGSSSLSSIIFDPPRPSFVHPGERTDTPHWFNPCNGTDSSAEKSSPSSEENELLFVNVIRLTCEQAIFQFEQFRQRYIKKTFKSNNQTDFHSHKSYAWLRQNVSLTKGLGEKLSSEHLDSLDSLERTAIIAYGHLQRVAVGFEQVVYDSRMNNSDFQDEFIIAENNLKRILCEVRELIPDEKLRNFENANRNIMVDRLVSSQTHQDIRDWVIFREYMILVEYINQYMTYYLEKKTHQRDNLNH